MLARRRCQHLVSTYFTDVCWRHMMPKRRADAEDWNCTAFSVLTPSGHSIKDSVKGKCWKDCNIDIVERQAGIDGKKKRVWGDAAKISKVWCGWCTWCLCRRTWSESIKLFFFSVQHSVRSKGSIIDIKVSLLVVSDDPFQAKKVQFLKPWEPVRVDF